MKSPPHSAAFMVLMTAMFNQGKAATVVTASHTLPYAGARHFSAGAGMGTDGGITFDNRLVQTFTTEVGGFIEQVSFIAIRYPSTTADLRVGITTLSDGQPGPVLSTTELDMASFLEDIPGSPDTFASVADFTSQAVFLEAQSQYAIVFSTDTTEAHYRLYGDAPGYAGGALLRSQNGSPYEPLTHSSDLFFEVTVNAVPEPAAGFLAVVGVLVLGLGANIRRRSN